MCRWAAYCGDPIYISDIVTDPDHSLIQQSRRASQGLTPTNADGFGVAWYGSRPEPGLYRDIYPAWSDPNLKSLACQVQSGLFMAHVRASTGTATSRNNCHPFAVKRWSFMHNGQIGGFERFRKQADMMIADELYASRKGATDSEALFLLAMTAGLDASPKSALKTAVEQLQALSETRGEAPHMRITAAISDGEQLYALRAASDEHAPSLYYRREAAGWLVVSEPLQDDARGYTEVPSGSFCRFDRNDMAIEPF
ncbi:MAG: class II glutamine amidotransferase [Gammaproteobacteria bacterium]|nr:class II glutamine amidotransferase [Gammaproteobacteria bacterium]